MSQGISNQRPFGDEKVITMPRYQAAGGERFEMIPGKVGHFLESGYFFSEPSDQVPKGSQLDLDRYCIVLIPREVVTSQSIHPSLTSEADSELLILDRDQLVSKIQSALTSHVAAERLNSDFAEFGDIRVDFQSIEVRRRNRLVRLSAMEFKVLKYFIKNPNRVISRDELLNEVWGYKSYPCTRTVDNHVLRLRHKLEPEFSNPLYFRTAPGFGYRFTPTNKEHTPESIDSLRDHIAHRRQ